MLGDEKGTGGGIDPYVAPDSLVRYLVLVLCITTWSALGLGIVLQTSGTVDSAFHQSIFHPLRIAIWWGGAALASWTLLTGRGRQLTIGILMLGPAIRFFSYLGSWVTWVTPMDSGSPNGWYYASLQIPFMLVVVILALLLRRPGGQT